MLTKLLCEFGATALMIVFGVGVHCDTVLKGTKYQGSGHMFAITTWSFGISVTTGLPPSRSSAFKKPR